MIATWKTKDSAPNDRPSGYTISNKKKKKKKKKKKNNNNNNNNNICLTPNTRTVLPIYKRPYTATAETWQLYST